MARSYSIHKKRLILLTCFILLCLTVWNHSRGGWNANPTSWCSEEATALGPGQKVISYTLFNITLKNNTLQTLKRKLYKENFHCITASMKKRYPGWVMRIYTNYERDELHEFIHQKGVYLCDVRNLPHFGNIADVHPAVWRFIVLGDPTVSMFMVRDSDNDLTMREKFAVEEWILSKKPFHGMRDHPLHVFDVLAGEWGGNNDLLGYQSGHHIILEVLKEAKAENGFHRYGADQDIVANVIYGKYKDSFLIHDSYTCETFQDSVPFPIQRLNTTDKSMEYVGMPKQCWFETGSYEFWDADESKVFGDLPVCPMECRPSYGMNWEYC